MGGSGDHDDGLSALGRELRAAVGEEFRAEAEENERVAALARLRRRSLADVAREALHRGDEVQVGVGAADTAVRFTGQVVHAADDLVTLRTPGGHVHVRLTSPAFVRVVAPAAAGGTEATDGVTSFKARLYELELAARPVRVGCPLVGDELPVRIRAVATDHLLVVDAEGSEWALPLAAILYVAESGAAPRGVR